MTITEILTPLFESIVAIIGTVITGLAAIYLPKFMDAFKERTGVVITDQERAAVMQSIDTAKGLIETKIDQGLLKVSDITPTNPILIQAATEALNRVPDSATAQKVSIDRAATMIVARVDTSPSLLRPAVTSLQPLLGLTHTTQQSQSATDAAIRSTAKAASDALNAFIMTLPK